jgi:putative glutamine amidotransferase
MTKPLIGIGSDVYLTAGERTRAFAFDTYIQSLRRAGAVPVVIPPQPENAADVIAGLDGILLAGGDDCDPAAYGAEAHPTVEPMDPRRQANDLSLARLAREQGIPTLGICLGLQVMNVAAGGTLIQDIDSELQTEVAHVSPPENRIHHDVSLESGTRLQQIVGAAELHVNSSHHQAIKDVGAGLRVTAHAPDGVIEGLEDPRHPFYLGVQWHPEDMPDDDSATRLFGAFVAAARARAESKHPATDLSPAGVSASE